MHRPSLVMQPCPSWFKLTAIGTKPKEEISMHSDREHTKNYAGSHGEPLLTVAEFAAQIRATPACVRRWLALRKISAVKLGRLVRIPASERDRLVRDGLRPAKPHE
jgi:excisionase family DNA binding protein